MTGYKLIGQRRLGTFGGWSQQVDVAGRTYYVSLRPTKRVRIPFKPRGPGAYGWQYHGTVHAPPTDTAPRFDWYGRVPGSLGVRGLLVDAGVLEQQP